LEEKTYPILSLVLVRTVKVVKKFFQGEALSLYNYSIRKLILVTSRSFPGFGKSKTFRPQVLLIAWFCGDFPGSIQIGKCIQPFEIHLWQCVEQIWEVNNQTVRKMNVFVFKGGWEICYQGARDNISRTAREIIHIRVFSLAE
jgi:hypothetical protein